MKGKVPEEHEVVKVMQMISTTFEKFEKSKSKKERTSTINKDASARMIKSALGSHEEKLN